ncbi:MAG TPA: hypothetical protein VGR18_06255 [Rubrobacter sp.]|nr:hypothetical protein [Rubrobacter sp.]
MSDQRLTPSGGFDWESADDLTALPEPELRGLLARVYEEERLAAYRHELLRGRANLIRAELAGRGLAALTAEELARVLVGEEGAR